MKEIAANELHGSVIDMIGKEWMLVTAGESESFNTMTASWGSIGYFFNKPVATIVVRPERYTYEFLESSTHFTLTILEEGNREALTHLGKVSGRERNKIGEAGLTPTFTEAGNPTFEEARVVLECRKIYKQPLTEEGFIEHETYEKWFGEGHGNLHTLFMGEIERCWIKE